MIRRGLPSMLLVSANNPNITPLCSSHPLSRTLHKRGARVWSPANCSYHTEIMPGYSAMVRAEHRRSGVLLYLLCVRCGDWWHCTPPSHGTRPRNMNWLRKHRGSRHQAEPAPYIHPCFWMELNKLQHSVQSNWIQESNNLTEWQWKY